MFSKPRPAAQPHHVPHVIKEYQDDILMEKMLTFGQVKLEITSICQNISEAGYGRVIRSESE